MEAPIDLINTEAIEPMPHAPSGSDSGYDEQTLSTASIASSIYDYEHENGRTYHAYKAGKYALPNDEGEQERMDLCYHSLRLTLNNRHFLAPIEHPMSILDVGTGTGIWAMDVADDYPGAHVIGTDLSPIQPNLVPPNLEFQVADAEEDWDMPGRFDLVHTRFMNGFSIRSWPQFYKQAFASLRPGGWVENQEFDLHWSSDDGSMPANGAFEKWQRLWEQAVDSVGMTARCYPEVMKQQMEEAGFVNVSIAPFKMPLGPWPKDKRLREAGTYLYVSMYEGLKGLSLRVFTQMLDWSVDELEVLLALVRAEWKRKAMHVYVPIYVMYGQKPPATQSPT